MLTPKEIQSKEFGKSFRGFDETEVNDFLNEIIKDYTALLDGNETLRAELACAQKTVEEFRLIEQGMRETLTVAQKTADEITANARQSADQMLETAAKEAQELTRKANLSAQAQLEEAAGKVRGIVSEYERLVKEKHTFLRRMKCSVQEELARLDEEIAGMPDMAVRTKTSRPTEQSENE